VSVVDVVVPADAEGAWIEIVELDRDAGAWGGSREGRPDSFGTAAEVLAALTSRLSDDPWVTEVVAALDRESRWGFADGWRRPVLEVFQGTGHMLHITAVANRESVRRHGLDWRRMGAAAGIAGSTRPELPAVFVCDEIEDISFFLNIARTPADVWAIDVAGMWVESGPDGWWIISRPIGPERLTLVQRNVVPASFGHQDA
jgi:hypothetical protein